MNVKVKIFLRKIFPLGLLVFVDGIKNKILNKFRYLGFLKEWKQFKSAAEKINDERFSLSSKDFYPILYEKSATHNYDRHYVYHLAWAARKLNEIKPEYHVDISSSLHFSTIVSAFIPVKFYDYRATDIQLSNLTPG